MADTGQDIGAPTPVLALEKAVLRTSHECVLADAWREHLVLIGIFKGAAVVTSEVRCSAPSAVEIVSKSHVPVCLGVLLQAMTWMEADISTAKIELVVVRIGILNDALDSLPMAGLYAGACCAQHLDALLWSLLLAFSLRLNLRRGCLLLRRGLLGSDKGRCRENDQSQNRIR